MLKPSHLLAGLCLFSLTSCLTTGEAEAPSKEATAAEQPQHDIRAEIGAAFNRSEDYTLKILEAMPEDLYQHKAAPDVFPFVTQMTHGLDFATGQIGRVLGQKPSFQAENWQGLSKEETRTRISQRYDWLREAAQQATTEQLYASTTWQGMELPTWRMFYVAENHLIHHRGQAVIYLRQQGITPPGYTGW